MEWSYFQHTPGSINTEKNIPDEIRDSRNTYQLRGNYESLN